MTTPVASRALADAGERQRILSELDRTFFVEAAAGTGKTTALIGRIIALIAQGRGRLGRLIAVTFTEKAAAEMKLRLRTELERARRGAEGEPSKRLDEALRELEIARIGTIHALCADLLREYPIHGGVDPLFAVAAEDGDDRTYRRAFERWFQGMIAAPSAAMRRVLARGSGTGRVRDDLYRAGKTVIEHRSFRAGWRLPGGFQREAMVDRMLDDLAGFAAHGEGAPDGGTLAKLMRRVAVWLRQCREQQRIAGGRDYDFLEKELVGVHGWKEWTSASCRRTRFSDLLSRDEATALREELSLGLERFARDADAELAVGLREALQGLAQHYDQLKQRAGELDFTDLLERVKRMLCDDHQLRNALQQRFDHVFVDEFQDTSPLQAEILLLLAAADPRCTDWRQAVPVEGKFFAVGDPKQAIYGFRRANVALYMQIKARLLADGAQLVTLSTNFRSVPTILGVVNHAFAEVMTGVDGQAEYVQLHPHRPATNGQPAVVALPVPEPFSSSGAVTGAAVDASYPGAVGGFVAWLLRESGWQVREKQTDRNRPITSGDICLIFRKLRSFGKDATRLYARALDGHAIPHVLIGGYGFYDRDEVRAVRNALAAIEWPDDRLGVYATLRGPLFGFNDAELLGFLQEHGHLHPLAAISDADSSCCAHSPSCISEALTVLAQHHRHRNRRPIAETLVHLLASVRAHAGLAHRVGGVQALANVRKLAQIARTFERRGATSFRSFVDFLDREAERGETAEAQVVEEGSEGVRMLTAHKSKGLEFPVVILCTPMAPNALRSPTRFLSDDGVLWAERLVGVAPLELAENEQLIRARDINETVRLAYVASTRARDLLVVPVAATGPLKADSWIASLDPALYPAAAARRQSGVAAGCPAFGELASVADLAQWSVRVESTVRPGEHLVGPQRVVWWDPRILTAATPRREGIERHELLAGGAPGEFPAALGSLRQMWEQQMTARQQWAAQASWRQRVVTSHARENAAPELQELPRCALSDGVHRPRPSGPRFGSLLHAVLAEVGLSSEQGEIAAVVGRLSRQFGAGASEAQAASDAVAAVLAHPLLIRAAQATRCLQEVPIVHPLPDGTLLEGTIDLAFCEASTNGWVVVDFKSDLKQLTAPAHYLSQVAWYCAALQALTGARVEGYLLGI